MTEAPERAAVLCDIDGTLAPIVERAEDAQVPKEVSRLLAAIARRYRSAAAISGRSAADARRVVGVGRMAYAGSHGAELLLPGADMAELVPEFASWADGIRAFAADLDSPELRTVRVRIEDKGAIAAFHWRGAPDEDAARARVEDIAEQAEAAGLLVHWGRKVLEVRPPVPVHKGLAVRELLRRSGVRRALFAGDDVTDLDCFDALDALEEDGALEAAVRVGIASEEGPPEIVERADLVVDGPDGFVAVLEALAEA